VQVLARAGQILRYLAGHSSGVAQLQIAKDLGLPRSTVHRLLNALAAEGLVDPLGSSGRFRIGNDIVAMAGAARNALVSEIHAHLVALSEEVGETVDLSTADRAQMTFIDQVVAPNRLRAVSMVGASFPMHCTANGKAVLATMSDREIARRLPGELQRLTGHTRDLPALLDEIVRIRSEGYAIDDEEHHEGICAIGVALVGTPLGEAAISIPMPATRFAAKKTAASAALIKTARRIESGWNAP